MRKLLVAMATIACIATIGGASLASDPPPPPSGEANRVALATALVNYGMEQQDAVALAQAAKMFRGFSARVLEAGEVGQDGKAVDPDTLVEKAREFAQGDDQLLQVIAAIDAVESGGKPLVYVPYCVWQWQYDYWGNFHFMYVCF